MMHNLPTTPGALIGYLPKSGRPVYVQAGGNGEGDGNPGNTGQGTGQGGQNGDPNGDQGQQQGQQAPQQGQSNGWKPNGDFDPDKASRLIENLKGDLASEKEKRASSDKLLAQMAQKLGIDVNGKPDPDQLQQTITTREGELKQSRIENAILRSAPKLDADMDALLDSRTFLAQLDDLDPADKTFAANVEKAIKAAIEANPRLKKASSGDANGGQGDAKTGGQAPPRTGAGDFNGSPGGNRQWTADDVAKATPEQLDKAITDGLLNKYLNA